MRIAHVTATFPPYYAGAGMVCYHNARGLARRGHQVTVLTAGGQLDGYVDAPEIAVRRLPALFRLGNAPFLPDLLGLRDFDVVHLHLPFIFGAEMTALAARQRRIPYVVTYHNDLIGAGLRRYLFDAYMLLVMPAVLTGARKFAVVSMDHALAARPAALFRLRPADVVEIPNGVDTDLFRPDADGRRVRACYDIPAEAVVILFVGVLDRAHYFKGAEFLLQAGALLNDRRIFLLLAGDGDLKKHYMAMAQTLGIAGRVFFAGAVPNERLPEYYGAADMVVLPSRPPESFGVVLIEAMACGKPVIASNLPGVRTVVTDGREGLLVTPGDVADLAEKIRLLAEHPELRAEMGAHGRARVEAQYAWSRIVPKLEILYRLAAGQ